MIEIILVHFVTETDKMCNCNPTVCIYFIHCFVFTMEGLQLDILSVFTELQSFLVSELLLDNPTSSYNFCSIVRNRLIIT